MVENWNTETEIPVGETFEMNGITYKAFEDDLTSDTCTKCAFINSHNCYISPECRPGARGDGKNLFYRKVGTESVLEQTKAETKQNMERKFEITEQETRVKNIFNKEDEQMIEHLIRKMLGLSDDIELDDNLKETPHRVLKLWTEMTEGYREDPAKHLEKVFPVNSRNLADDADTFSTEHTAGEFHKGIVVVSTNAWSNCCHHLAPMHCRVDVAYIPKDKVVGLSKIVRCVKAYGKRLNLQEGWQENIANAMMEKLNPLGVIVRISGVHSCVAMRGAAEQTSKTTTACVRGCFATDMEAREEAYRLMDQNNMGEVW